jgi:acyl-CoA synthetase (AMP-forming)/AMP-acid ligase II
VNKWSPGRLVLNTYGPTEKTVTASFARLLPNRKVAIGNPLPSYTMHLLDEARQPVSIGEVGEVFIGGIGVARGYLNRPEKTAEVLETQARTSLMISPKLKQIAQFRQLQMQVWRRLHPLCPLQKPCVIIHRGNRLSSPTMLIYEQEMLCSGCRQLVP